MIKVVNFDFIPSEYIYSRFISLQGNKPFDDEFERLGNYGNSYLILSMGTLFIFFLWHCFLLVAFISITLLDGVLNLPCDCHEKLQSW